MKKRELKPERGTAIGRAALDGQIVHIPDVEQSRCGTSTYIPGGREWSGS